MGKIHCLHPLHKYKVAEQFNLNISSTPTWDEKSERVQNSIHNLELFL